MQVAISQKHLKLLIFVLLVITAFSAHSQSLLSHGFAHNDYWHKRPLYDALDNGYSHIEADIYLRKRKLIVAHVLPFFKKKNTLEQLYFNPLLQSIQGRNKMPAAPLAPITLMIDIKSEADKTYAALEQLMQKYTSILSSYDNGKITYRQVTVVITGHKPNKTMKAQTSRLAFIDEDLLKVGQDTVSTGVYQTASCKYANLITWQGEGEMPAKEKERLCSFISIAHKNEKKVRLWASPENTSVWQVLLDCGVDLINTDKLVALRDFLQAQQTVFAKNDRAAVSKVNK